MRFPVSCRLLAAPASVYGDENHSFRAVVCVIPITERLIRSQTTMYVRAMTDHSPQQDPTIPCAHAGMIFRRGDILEIVDQTDTLWWQAKKLPSSTACAGLIPSTSLLKRLLQTIFSARQIHR
ncbi:MAGUK p55 subfamily member 4-like [Archocentrus centrarchus]|uniref:MAGUK p55 subfamily member 4-like n=1 Tax=Archocentrus centrarchus TaxID=63155 RepID=UPI0011E9E9F2|nr:MAGUK p55 subfamily member 4-like [Archocentrus centrarchus]XP_030590667.1 MAGUK p55 subfamily member 4-like [Archocentrus centrarchus]